MNQTLIYPRAAALGLLLAIAVFLPPRARAVEALLLQDTYVDNGTHGDQPPTASNYGSGVDLRVFKGNGRLGRAFLKFTLETLPAGTRASDVSQARLRLWVNSNSTAAGSITLSPVTAPWDEYTLTDELADKLTFGEPRITELSVESINSFISIDVTVFVKAWLDGSLPNEGILVESGDATDLLDLAFDSKESDGTSHEARLEISLRQISDR